MAVAAVAAVVRGSEAEKMVVMGAAPNKSKFEIGAAGERRKRR